MSNVAQPLRARRQSRREAQMDRKDVYLGDGLKRALKGAPGTLSTNVNLYCDRYMGMVEHSKSPLVMSVLATPEWVVILRKVLAEGRGHRVEAREVFGFAGIVQGATVTQPERSGLLAALTQMSYVELVALIDTLERQP